MGTPYVEVEEMSSPSGPLYRASAEGALSLSRPTVEDALWDLACCIHHGGGDRPDVRDDLFYEVTVGHFPFRQTDPRHVPTWTVHILGYDYSARTGVGHTRLDALIDLCYKLLKCESDKEAGL